MKKVIVLPFILIATLALGQRFKGYTYDELARPLQQAQAAHNQAQSTLEGLIEECNDYYYLAKKANNDYVENLTVELSNYLNSIVSDLNRYGISGNISSRISTAKTKLSTIKSAYKTDYNPNKTSSSARLSSSSSSQNSNKELGEKYLVLGYEAYERKDTMDAFRYWENSSVIYGNPDGYAMLGWAYLTGYGVHEDYKKAISYFEKAAMDDVTGAKFFLGVCYEFGYGCHPNRDIAISWYTKAAKDGEQNAIDNLENIKAKPFVDVNDYSQLKTVDFPTIAKKGETNIDLYQIQITDKYTVLKFNWDNQESDPGWISIKKEAYLLDKNGRKYKLIASNNCEYAPNFTNVDLHRDLYFQLYFEPIPMSCQTIDFIEPGSGWQFYGIQLQVK